MGEICFFTPHNLLSIASQVTASHIVSLSGGLASALAAERVIARYGREAVALWFADTQYEDEDLYRFLLDLMQRWGGVLYWYTDGRTPLDVAEQKKLIPCNLAAPCSYELKVKPFRRFIQAMPTLPVVHIGLDHWEKRRLCSVTESYAKAIPQATVVFPLLWSIETRPLVEVCRQDWHIEPPRLYTLGFPHNNCGGRCVRQGRSQWLHLARHFPERYAACEEWEQASRAKGGARANRSFCSFTRAGKKYPLTLTDIRVQAHEGLWERKELHPMPKREPLPADDHMSVIALEGRYYPVRTKREKDTRRLLLDGDPHVCWEEEYAFGIPYALGPQPTQGIISFGAQRLAVEFCHRFAERFQLQWNWEQLVAQTELYPERNAWYGDELVALVGRVPVIDVVGRHVYGSLFLRDGTHCYVWATNRDEAWEKLYVLVEVTLQTMKDSRMSA